MSGQRIPLVDKARSAVNIYRAHRRSLFSNAAGAVRYHRNLLEYLETYTSVPPTEARVLDLGCGQQATQTLLFQADGAMVTGIDTEVSTHRMTPGVFFRAVRHNGWERAIKSLARQQLFDRKFFAELQREVGRTFDFRALDVRIMDATAMEFEDSSFDFVLSTAVFEHIGDVLGAAREVNRVLKPGGVAVITPHLFPSLSGGHNLEWASPDARPARRAPPWDHLRENRFPPNTWLNHLKLGDYTRMFREAMEVVDEVPEFEGEQFLTPELERELGAKGYTREDLTTRTTIFFCRKLTRGGKGWGADRDAATSRG